MAHRRIRTTIIASLVVLVAGSAASQVPLGSEFRVDTRGNVQYFVRTPQTIAQTGDEGFVVVWQTTNGQPFPGTDHDVVARRFDATGNALGPEILVSSGTARQDLDASVGADAAGNFVVVWNAETSTFWGVVGQRFDASGLPVGSEFVVRDNAAGAPWPATVAVAPTGQFVVVWLEHYGSSTGNVHGRLFAASGAPVGAAFQVSAGNQRAYVPSVDIHATGTFVVVWEERLYPGRVVLGRRYASGGAPLGAAFTVNSGAPTDDHALPVVATAGDGSFAVTWTAYSAGPGSPRAVLARRFAANGLPLGSDLTVAVPPHWPSRPTVDSDADGDFTVAWFADGSDRDVFAARVAASGVPVSGFFRVNTYTTGRQGWPGIASDPAGNFVVTWRSEQNGVDGLFAQRYAGGLMPSALVIDSPAGPNSDGNGVFEAGETVVVAPSWLNANFGAEAFTGMASSFAGPGGPGDPTYTIADGAANYGTVASNATGGCTTTSDCYALGITVPTTRPSLHWDAALHEVIAPANLGATKTWTLHVGESFADVPRSSAFYRFVETLLHRSVTGGCTTSEYCPSFSATREQMVVFVLAAKDGPGNIPPACGATPMFVDVPASSPFCPWIEELARRGVVAGCGGGNYCPTAVVSREQMAVFVLLTKEPGLTPPACGVPMFGDVPASSPFCRWIEELVRRAVVTGCGGGNYCPAAAVTREQMAVFISAGFGLQLYGP
jgi:hypothetical protein